MSRSDFYNRKILNSGSLSSLDVTGVATFNDEVIIKGNLTISNSASQTISFGDNDFLNFGNNNDLKLVHDGGDSFIENNTGDLKIIQKENNADIRFFCDDGTGSVAEYFRLDGGDADGALVYTKWADNSIVTLGASKDLRIFHNGTNSIIQNYTGNLSIRNGADNSDIIFDCDDGSGGLTEYLRIDGSSEKTFYSKPILLFDSVALQLGTDTDATLFHSGGEGTLQNFTGNFRFLQMQDNGDIQFKISDGSGGVTEYLRFDGGAAKTIFSKPVDFGADDTGHDVVFYGDTSGQFLQWDASHNRLEFKDEVKAVFGTNNDASIQFDANSNFKIQTTTGDIIIQNTANDKDIEFKSDDGSGGTTAYITLDGSETEIHLHKTVGIGTTNPDTNYKLDVAGKVQVQSVLELDDVLTLNAISTPADPAANQASIYMDSADGAIKAKIRVGDTVVTRTLASFE
tara:strand:- start:80 stop:1450 length:1371 start_codon:yes stop_codon:yes gene_type:complete